MKHYILLILIFVCVQLEATKIIGLVAVRNEELLIEQCLRGLAVYTDSIIVLDDASEDNTVEIIKSLAQECSIEKILRKKVCHRTESADRNLLLQEGRKLGGTHFIVVDADELFTATCMHNDMLRKRLLELEPGDTLFMHWIRLWKNVHHFKARNIELKHIAFCDNGTATYPPRYLHSYRTPAELNGRQVDLGNYVTHGLLHFQAVNWRNMLLRQAWYQCLDRIRKPYIDPQKIVKFYKNSVNESDLALALCPQEWFTYDFFDENVYYQPDTWREQQVEMWMREYGVEYFKDLDIWNIDWHFEIAEIEKYQT